MVDPPKSMQIGNIVCAREDVHRRRQFNTSVQKLSRTSELGREGSVTGTREGVCLDPGERDTILGTGGPAPPGKGEGQQLVPDSGGGET